ncbi:hypothetical protein K7432_001229 [Basidiobolus ranarum]|uniref:Uncharacterized protein n=1 Tax=Basidiobolus ranarum TaxID=34480 RepID=A0ABR2X3N0_9FUNG
MKLFTEKSPRYVDITYTLELSKMHKMLRSYRSKLNAIINHAKSSPSAFAAYISGETSTTYSDMAAYDKKSKRSGYNSYSLNTGGPFETTIIKHEASLVEAYRHLLVKLWPKSTREKPGANFGPPSLGVFASQVLGKHLGKEKCHKRREKYYEMIPGHFRRDVLVAHLVQECKQYVRSYNFYRILVEVYCERKLTLQVIELLDYLTELRPLGLHQEFHFAYTMSVNHGCVNRLIDKLDQTMSIEQYLCSGFTEYVEKISSSHHVIRLLTIAWKSLIQRTKVGRSVAKDALVQMRIQQWTSTIVAKFMSIQDDQDTSHSTQTEHCGTLIAQLTNELTQARIPAFTSCCLALDLVLLNYSFVHSGSQPKLNTKYWVNQIRKLLFGSGRVNLDIIILSYKTHQNLLALGRTCQKFNLHSLAMDIVNCSLSRYDEIRQESDLDTCPTVSQLTEVVRELEKQCVSNQRSFSKTSLEPIERIKNIPNQQSFAYGLSCPRQIAGVSNKDKRKLLSKAESSLNKRLEKSIFGAKRKISNQNHSDEEYSPNILKKSKTKTASRERNPLRNITSKSNVPTRSRRMNAGNGVGKFWVVPPVRISTQDKGRLLNHKHQTENHKLVSNTMVHTSAVNAKRVRPLPSTQIDELCI